MRSLIHTTVLAAAIAVVVTTDSPAATGGYTPAFARKFRISPEKQLNTIPPRVTIRVNQRGAESVGVKLVFTPVRGRGVRATVDLGRILANRTVRPAWPAQRQLSPGRYRVRLAVNAAHGAKLARTPRSPGRTTVVVKRGPVTEGPITAGIFPIAGPHSYGGADGRFGAQRDSHLHEGQDISASSGATLVTPTAGTVRYTDYQAGGAGHYIVIDAVDGRAFMFAHLRSGSTMVLPGQPVAAGQAIGQVGSSGSSTGPHLHFEIWLNGWRISAASRPVDPLAQLLAWDPDY